MNARIAVSLVAASLLASCGGGGSGTDGNLYVDVQYPAEPVKLLQDTIVVAQTFGFGGHAPQCSQNGGTLPMGMQVRTNCDIVGRPGETGHFGVTIQVGASGASGSIQVYADLEVRAPQFAYPFHGFIAPLEAAQKVQDEPSFIQWTPPADVSITYRYALESGALPPGLALDPDTGTISGVTLATGEYSPEILMTISSTAGSGSARTVYDVKVRDASFSYELPDGACCEAPAQIGRQFSMPVLSLAGESVTDVHITDGALPPGLSLDAVSGRISGVPTGPATPAGPRTYPDVALGASLTRNGATVPVVTQLNFRVID